MFISVSVSQTIQLQLCPEQRKATSLVAGDGEQRREDRKEGRVLTVSMQRTETPACEKLSYKLKVCLNALDVQFQRQPGWPQVCQVEGCGIIITRQLPLFTQTELFTSPQ